MNSDSAAESTIRTTKGSTVSPHGSHRAGMVSILNHAQNCKIHGITFVTNVKAAPSLKVLHKSVAPNAILNAGAGTDGPECHHRTRELVIDVIEKWRDERDGSNAPILWLSGPAGAGKTAIMKTIADRCIEQEIPQASFFFFQEDSSRDTKSPLVATLLHQVILHYPSVQETVAPTLSANPGILDSALADQFAQLITNPLRLVQESSPSYRQLLLLIDGLDECDAQTKNQQRDVLRALDKALAEPSCPFRVLMASRDEPQLTMGFNQLSSRSVRLYLDQKYSPDIDIRHFVTDRLRAVGKTHHLKDTLDENWPSSTDIERIVEKSSGQFIYAATVVRSISHSPESPALNLRRIQMAAPLATNLSIFSELDAVYTSILSRVENKGVLQDVLRTQCLKQESDRHAGRFSDLEPHATLQEILSIYNSKYVDHDIVRSCAAYLTAIAQYTPQGQLVFYHASFPDYLLDQSRSGDYFVDVDGFNLEVLPLIWKSVGKMGGVECIAYYGLCRLQKLPPNFLNILNDLSLSTLNLLGNIEEMKDIFRIIHSLCASADDVENYKRVIRRWIKYYHFALGEFDVAKEGLPCSESYIMMAEINRQKGDVMPTPNVVKALRPASDFDTRELESWVCDLLKRIHTHHYPHRIESYKQFMEAWIFWAISNDITLKNLGYFPYARRYFWQSTVAKRVTGLQLAYPWIWTIIHIAIAVSLSIIGLQL